VKKKEERSVEGRGIIQYPHTLQSCGTGAAERAGGSEQNKLNGRRALFASHGFRPAGGPLYNIQVAVDTVIPRSGRGWHWQRRCFLHSLW
jgi:hypothetical protein